jgi:hypothetical protein
VNSKLGTIDLRRKEMMKTKSFTDGAVSTFSEIFSLYPCSIRY